MMLSGLLSLLGTLFGWLGDLLPDSPFAAWMQVTDDLVLGLGWLNWVLPLGEMLTMLSLWIAAMLAVTAFKIGMDTMGHIAGKVTN